jgi:hypothetical protein
LIYSFSLEQLDQAWEAYLDQGWDKAAVQVLVANIPQLAPQVCLYCVEFPVLNTKQLLGSKDGTRQQCRNMFTV